MTEPPPPRYRVVERGRRLEVIDTHTNMLATRPVPGDANRTAAPRPTSPAFRAVALAFCLGATDAEGRPILSTVPTIDGKAPREVPLGPVGVRRLARTVIGTVAAVAGLLIIAATIWAGLSGVMIVALVFGASRIQPVTTRLIDGLEALGGR